MLLVIHRIPVGQVATYGQIARLAGKPKNSRQVGAVLRGLKADSNVPWHRVVNAKGEISRRTHRLDCESTQAERLRCEGVEFDDSLRIDLTQYQWDPSG
ncbi:UNVERIFIED_CONTAM: hypothetical protein GTU68_025403 [Idotea baltica]|nr:hypothetical protein [Idotea baltica]